MPTDLEIARSIPLRPITEVAAALGLRDDELELYGCYKAKVRPDGVARVREERRRAGKPSHLVLVSAITPTPAGEGKTTTSIGLAMALNGMGEPACLALRQPSLGPTLGMKGGATGGGRAQIAPVEDINLGFTGDFDAVASAHNLLAAMADNHIYWRQEPPLDPRRVRWGRVLDLNDRELRNVVMGLGDAGDGVPRASFFDITAASEVMAILCLAEDLPDLKRRLGDILVGFTYKREPVFARDLKAAGAMTALLRRAFWPNLVQTLEGTPALVHGGPFANIAQGTNSVVATKGAMALADWCITEAGFGFDLGAEKFFDLKCVSARLDPCAVVLVATVRALKMHGGVKLEDLAKPDAAAVERGLPNLAKHLESIEWFKESPLVALNRFGADTDDEIKVVRDYCAAQGVPFAVSDHWARGGEGATALAEVLRTRACACDKPFTPMYDWLEPVEDKIYKVASKIYGAQAVDYTPDAREDLATIKKLGFEKLPICIAKTQKSLSDNPDLLGRPKDFLVTVRRILINAGAGFLVPLTGDIIRMPGLPREPLAVKVDVDEGGEIIGLE